MKPSVYVLGGKPEIDMTVYDINGDPFIPVYARLSIKAPGGTITTVSGGAGVPTGEMSTGSGYLYYLYRPLTIGWYEYEQWGADGNWPNANAREGTDTSGFEIIDKVY